MDIKDISETVYSRLSDFGDDILTGAKPIEPYELNSYEYNHLCECFNVKGERFQNKKLLFIPLGIPIATILGFIVPYPPKILEVFIMILFFGSLLGSLFTVIYLLFSLQANMMTKIIKEKKYKTERISIVNTRYSETNTNPSEVGDITNKKRVYSAMYIDANGERKSFSITSGFYDNLRTDFDKYRDVLVLTYGTNYPRKAVMGYFDNTMNRVVLFDSISLTE